MRIDHQILTGAATQARAAATAQRWLVGQLLTIGVIGRLDESSIKLVVDGRELIARTPLDLAPGTTLTARVVTAGAQPLLAVLDPKPAQASAAGASVPAATTLRAGFSSALPLQEPMNAVLNRLEPRAGSNAAPPAVQARLLMLSSGAPDLPSLAQPANLARAVANAGALFEATLAAAVEASADAKPGARATVPPHGDLKFQLLDLRQAIDVELKRLPQLTSASPLLAGARVTTLAADDAQRSAQASLRSLAQDVDAGIARITTHQLQHLAAAERGDFYAFTELPFRTAAGLDTVTLSIDADEPPAEHRGDDADPGSVALTLAVPLSELGELRARIGLSGDRLAVTLWSEEPALRELIVEDIEALADRLTALGFELTPLTLREVASPDPLRELPQRLIDTSI